MKKYKLSLEIINRYDNAEEFIDRVIKEALYEYGVMVVDSLPFEEISDDSNIFNKLEEFTESYSDDNIEVTIGQEGYYVLHICNNNVPVALYYSKDIDDIVEYFKNNYGYDSEDGAMNE